MGRYGKIHTIATAIANKSGTAKRYFMTAVEF
jgi:hypothetical protein